MSEQNNKVVEGGLEELVSQLSNDDLYVTLGLIAAMLKMDINKLVLGQAEKARLDSVKVRLSHDENGDDVIEILED